MHPGGLALVWHLKHGVSDRKVIIGKQGKELQSILIDISNSVPADDTAPDEVIGTNPGFEISKEDDLVRIGDAMQCLIKEIVELILNVIRGDEDRCIGTDDSGIPVRSEWDANCHEALTDADW